MENTRFRGEEREGGQPASLIHSIETIGHFFIVIIIITLFTVYYSDCYCCHLLFTLSALTDRQTDGRVLVFIQTENFLFYYLRKM